MVEHKTWWSHARCLIRTHSHTHELSLSHTHYLSLSLPNAMFHWNKHLLCVFEALSRILATILFLSLSVCVLLSLYINISVYVPLSSTHIVSVYLTLSSTVHNPIHRQSKQHSLSHTHTILSLSHTLALVSHLPNRINTTNNFKQQSFPRNVSEA